MKYMNIAELKVSKDTGEVHVAALVKNAEGKTTANGKPYVDFELTDKTGTINGKRWGSSDVPEIGTVIEVAAKLDEWQGVAQLNVQRFAPLPTEDIAKFIQSSHRPPQELLDEIRTLIADVCEGNLYTLIDDMLSAYEEQIISFPAAKGNHHARHGGLVEHTHSMAHLAVATVAHYESRYGKIIDVGLLVAGVVLHDLGKVFELSGSVGTEYTTSGKLVGHIPLGVLMLDKVIANSSAVLSDETVDRLMHMVLSHHGRLEWGSPVTPKTPEAILLHQLDMVDSRMDALATLIKEAPEEAEWTGRCRTFDNQEIYLGKRGE